MCYAGNISNQAQAHHFGEGVALVGPRGFLASHWSLAPLPDKLASTILSDMKPHFKKHPSDIPSETEKSLFLFVLTFR